MRPSPNARLNKKDAKEFKSSPSWHNFLRIWPGTTGVSEPLALLSSELRTVYPSYFPSEPAVVLSPFCHSFARSFTRWSATSHFSSFDHLRVQPSQQLYRKCTNLVFSLQSSPALVYILQNHIFANCVITALKGRVLRTLFCRMRPYEGIGPDSFWEQISYASSCSKI